MKKLAKIFFVTSALTLFVVMVLSVVGSNGVKKAIAHTEDNAPTGESGEYSETWQAIEITGQAVGFDGFVAGNKALNFGRLKETGTSDNIDYNTGETKTIDSWYLAGAINQFTQKMVNDGRASLTLSQEVPNLSWVGGDAYHDGHLTNTDHYLDITKWKVDGHMHP